MEFECIFIGESTCTGIRNNDYNITRHTVQTFSSCTSRPDVCQCLVVQNPLITCQKKTQALQ